MPMLGFGIQIDPTFSLGTLSSVILFLVGVGVAYQKLKSDHDSFRREHRADMSAVKETLKRDRYEAQTNVDRTAKRIDAVEHKLDDWYKTNSEILAKLGALSERVNSIHARLGELIASCPACKLNKD